MKCTNVTMNSKTFCILLFFTQFFIISLFSSCAEAQPIQIVNSGLSDYTIVIPNDAPKSLKDAALEFQECFAIATGAQLPIKDESEFQKGKVISLGETVLSSNIGVDVSGIRDEGFFIVTKGDNIYILGKDTPDDDYTTRGGKSNGTSNGVYTFLEDYLGVRWLLPGEMGRDIPESKDLAIDSINRKDEPRFIYRRLTYLTSSNGPVGEYIKSVRAWERQQKLGYSINLSYSHNWHNIVPMSMYKQHPDWFAEKGGKRVKPSGIHYKLETTNPDLIEYIADEAIEKLKTNDRWQTFSISPSDLGEWSESNESKSLYDSVMPDGKPIVSSLVLKYYNDVSEVVKRKYPEGELAGYLYADYIQPPTKYSMKLPNNFIPIIAPSFNYGFQLYRNNVRQEFSNIMDSWANLAPDIWIYFDIPNQFMRYDLPYSNARIAGNSGIITPSSAENLSIIFTKLIESKIKGAYVYGSPVWSNSALNNYVLAKLLWNPELDPYEIQKDWLSRAYGNEAGEIMLGFYEKLDDLMKNYYENNAHLTFVLTDEILKNFYAENYERLEKEFLRTSQAKTSAMQAMRLQLIEDNFKILQWRLKNAGFLDRSYTSSLSVDDIGVNEIINKSFDGIMVIPEAVRGNLDRFEIPKVVSSMNNISSLASSQVRDNLIKEIDDNTILISSPKDTVINVSVLNAIHGATFATFQLRDSKGEVVISGLLSPDIPIKLTVKKETPYYLYIPRRDPTSYEINLGNVQTAISQVESNVDTSPVVIFSKQLSNQRSSSGAVILSKEK